MKNAYVFILVFLSALILISSCVPMPEQDSSSSMQQPPSRPLQQGQMPDNPLMDHDTYITFSNDGKNWDKGSLIRESASVPDIIQLEKDIGRFKKDDLLVYFVDASKMAGPSTEQLGIISSSDSGKTWIEEGVIKLTGKKNKGGAVDPSIVQLEDGSLRLYFFGLDTTSGDPAMQEGKHKVYSAKSSDGINFIAEEGASFEDEKLTDPEVIYFNGKWLMYYSVGASSKLAMSDNGLDFTAVDVTGGNIGGIPGALALDNGVRIFGCRKGISAAISSDGINFKLEQNDILNTGEVVVCDPAAVKLADGRYAMIYKAIEKEQKSQTEEQQMKFTYSEEKLLFTNGYADPSVIKMADGSYFMYLNKFNQKESGYFVLTSEDALEWKEKTGIIFPGTATGRAFLTDKGVRFYYPTAMPRTPSEPASNIISSFAADGINFNKDDGIRIEPRQGYYLSGPAIIRLKDGTYRMFFDESDIQSGNIQKSEIYGASSSDGLNWVRDEDPSIIAEDNIETGTIKQVLHPFIVEWKNGYLMLYNSHTRVFAAHSEDGFKWKKLGNTGLTGADMNAIALPDGSFRVYFGRFSESTSGEVYTAILKIQ